jgi:hypothetical protein
VKPRTPRDLRRSGLRGWYLGTIVTGLNDKGTRRHTNVRARRARGSRGGVDLLSERHVSKSSCFVGILPKTPVFSLRSALLPLARVLVPQGRRPYERPSRSLPLSESQQSQMTWSEQQCLVSYSLVASFAFPIHIARSNNRFLILLQPKATD